MITEKAIKTLIFSFIPLLLLCASAEAAALITSVNRTDETTSTQLYFRFDNIPKYELKSYKRRVDILFKDTGITPEINLPEGDDRITRILSRAKNNNLTISLFFRYAPQKISENIRQEPASLMLDILLGNPFSSMYPDLSTRLQGLTLLDRETVDYTNPINISPYAEDWPLFFSEYEPPIHIAPATRYTLPPFPLAKALSGDLLLEEWMPELVIEKAMQNQWQLTAQMLLEQMEEEPDTFLRDLLLLSYAEALVRAGDYRTPHRLLQQISHRYQNSLIAHFADLLFIYIRAVHEANFLGYYEIKQVIEQLGTSTPFNAYLTLLLAETAMDMGKLDDAEKLLSRDDIAFAGTADQLRAMRRADLHFLNNKKIKALVAYLELNKRSQVINDHPESLARFADLLYEFTSYEQAKAAYLSLSELLGNKKHHELALYRLAMCRRRTGTSTRQTQNELFQIEDAFPGTEGAYRATMKQMDLDYVEQNADHAKAFAEYGRLSQVANTVDLREEAEFKQALVLLLSGKQLDAIKKCQSILREFQTGKLRVEARALIIQRLPTVLTEMVENNQYIDALVLAQQNRQLFARGWIATDFLYELATAYDDLGFFDRAARTYQYLFDTSSGEDQEKIYLPLIESLYKDSQFDSIEDYADRFSFRYPESELLPQVYYYRLRALLRKGDTENTAKLLDTETRPTSEDIERFAVSFYYDNKRYEDVIEKLSFLTPATASGADRKQILMLAESYYKTGNLQDAEPFFQEVVKEDNTNEQALFRLAQIDLENGNRQQALNRFSQITEKGTDPLWKKLAQEEIALLQLQGKF